MKVTQDGRFREERARFELRFACEHCALWDVRGEQCAHGFPVDEHRVSYYQSHSVPIVFCKDFEVL